VIFVGFHRGNLREDLAPGGLAGLRVLTDDAWANFNFVTDFQDSFEDSTACNTSLEGVGILTWLVDVEGTDNYEDGRRDKVPKGDRDTADVVHYYVDVVLKLSRDWDDRSVLGHGTRDKLLYILVLLLGNTLFLHNQVYLVLNDNYVLELHDLDSGEMLTGLRLRARLVSCDQKKSRIHDCRTCKHSSHKHIMTWAINE
jgi:hypothetical protein